ncbi:MAG: ABC transporter substrate-binding protein [bacterium]
MKKAFWPVFVALMLIVAVSALGIEKIIEFWHPFGEPHRSLVMKMVDKFNKDNPDVFVKYVYVPTTAGSQSSEKLLTAIAGGNPPEVAHFDRFVVGSWAARGSLTDITDLAKKDGFTAEKYYNFAWQEATYEGRLYALPHDTDDRALYFNKKLFKEAGLDPNKGPRTIDELDAMAEKITKKDASGKYTRIGFVPWLNQGWLYTWGWAFGGKFYDTEKRKVTANDPRIVAALEWEVSYAKKYNVEAIDSFTTAFGSQALDPFLTGLLGMKSDGDWFLSYIKQYAPDLEFGVVPHPYPDGGKWGKGEPNSTWAGGWSGVIPKGAKNVEAGWQFLKWFYGSFEAQHWFNKETYHIPTFIEAAKDPFYWEDPNHAIFMKLLDTAHWRPVIPEGDLMWVQLREAVDFARFGKKTPQKALDDVTDTVNKALAKWFK